MKIWSIKDSIDRQIEDIDNHNKKLNESLDKTTIYELQETAKDCIKYDFRKRKSVIINGFKKEKFSLYKFFKSNRILSKIYDFIMRLK